MMVGVTKRIIEQPSLLLIEPYHYFGTDNMKQRESRESSSSVVGREELYWGGELF